MKLSEFLPSSKTVIEKGKPTRTEKIPPQKTLGGVLQDFFYNLLSGEKDSIPQKTLSNTPTPSPVMSAQSPDTEQLIRSGLTKYGGDNLPGLQYVPQLAEAAQKYPIFKANPYLLPQIMILETSGGRNITRPNNLLNWGISNPENNPIFAQMTPQQVLERAVSGMGERMPQYSKFRHGKQLTDEELEEFAQIYEPANLDYGRSLREGINFFLNQ